MKLGRFVSVSVALIVATAAFACGPSATDRQTGAAGAADAGAKLYQFMCACEERDEQDACETDGLEGYFADLPVECIDHVLVDFPADRQVLACQNKALYDGLDCLEATGCPEAGEVDASPGGRDEAEDGLSQEDPDDGAGACGAILEEAYGGGCGELSDAAIERIEAECDVGNEVCVSSDGREVDCDGPSTDANPGDSTEPGGPRD